MSKRQKVVDSNFRPKCKRFDVLKSTFLEHLCEDVVYVVYSYVGCMLCDIGTSNQFHNYTRLEYFEDDIYCSRHIETIQSFNEVSGCDICESRDMFVSTRCKVCNQSLCMNCINSCHHEKH